MTMKKILLLAVRRNRQLKIQTLIGMLVSILTISVVTTVGAQDFKTKQAPPKTRVIQLGHATTADKMTFKKEKKAKKVKRTHIPSIAFRDARTASLPSAVKKEQTRVPFMPKDARISLRPYLFSSKITARKAPAANGEEVDEHGIIVAPADGVRKVYTRSGMSYRNIDGLETVSQEGTVQIVECEDGTIYIRNIISGYPTGAWVKGSREGNTLSVAAKQPIFYNSQADSTFSIRWGVNEDFGFSYYDGYNGNVFTFTIDEAEGTLTLENSSETYFMGLFWDDDDSFAWQGDYETVWSYQCDYEPLQVVTVTPPAGLSTETWYTKGHEMVPNTDEALPMRGNVTIGFDGEDVYLKGLFPSFPDSWMRGHIDGENVTFSDLQLQGSIADNTYYAVGTDGGDLMDFTMTWDADGKILKSCNQLILNASQEAIRAGVWYRDLTIQLENPDKPIETLPYTNSFNTDDEWESFIVVDANQDGSTWHLYDNEEASYKYNSDNNADDWLISPAIRLEAGKTYTFSIDAHCSSDAYSERIEVKLGTDATAESMSSTIIDATELNSETATTLSNKLVTVDETGYYRFGIHAISDYDHASLRVDNMLVDETILTAPAAVTDLTATADAENPVATISFTAPTKSIGGDDLANNLTQIELMRDNEVIHTFEDVAPGTALSFVDDDPALTAGIYTYHVVAYNADGKGEQSAAVTVQLNIVYTIPYVADFTQDAVGNQFMQIDANDDGSRWEWDGGIHATYEYNSIQSADDYLISPPLHMDAGKNYSIVVNAGSAGYTERFEVLVGREATTESLVTKVLENCEVTDEDAKDFETSFSPSESGVYYVAVHCISDADMYELWINKVTVDFAPEPTAPAAPELSATSGEKGAMEAHININVPTTSIDGNVLTENLTKIDLYRGNDIINTFEDVAPGDVLAYVDNIIEAIGEQTYQAVPYNADGIGRKSEKVTVYVGFDVPASVSDVTATDYLSSVLLSWQKVGEVGSHGGYVDPQSVEYTIYACFPNSTVTDGPIASVTDADSYQLDFVTNEGEQGYQTWYVTARNDAGESYLEEESSATVLTGKPYDLPLVEGFAGGNSHYYWDSNSYPLLFSQSSDGDDGAMALTSMQAGDIFLTSGKLNVKDATNPTLLFDAAGFGVESVNVIGRIDSGDGVELATESLSNNSYKTVKVDLNSLKGGNYAQVGLTATITKPTVVDWGGEIQEEGDALVIDNIRIVDLLQHNLAVEVEAPTSVQAGKNASIKATVTNWGEQTAKDYTITISVGDEVIMQETIADQLAPFAKREFTSEYNTTVFDETGERTLRVQVDYISDMKVEDNIVEATISINDSSLPSPIDLTAEDKGDAGVELNWNAPVVEPADYTETFDNTDAFTTFSVGGISATQHEGSISEWTLYDGNGSEVYSWNNDNISYENRYAPSAWMPFDIAKAGFTNETGHSGTQVMMSMCPIPDEGGTAPAADHWLISPELPGTEQEISFYLRAITKQYGAESFEVLVSKTDNKVESFELLESFASDEESWTQFFVTLPEGTKYFAIRHTSTDIFGVMVDDITFNYGGTVNKFNIYYEDQLVATVENGVTTYTIAAEQLEGGEHTFAVTAVYANGQESKPTTATITVSSDIRQIIVEGEPIDIYTVDGRLLRHQATTLDGLRGVYVVNGRTVIIK